MKNSWKLIKTSAVLLAAFNAGFNAGVFSPTLPDIQALTLSTTAQMSNTLVWIGIAGIFGSILLGPLFDMVNGLALLSLCLCAQGFGFGAAPFSNILSGYQMILSIGFLFNFGLVSGTMSANCIIWRNQPKMIGPILQTTSLVYVVGTAISPQVVAPFLTKSNFTKNKIMNNTNFGYETFVTDVVNFSPNTSFEKDSKFAIQKESNSDSSFFSKIKPIQIAYLIVGLFDEIAALYCFIIFLIDKGKKSLKNFEKKKFVPRRRHYSTSNSMHTTTPAFDSLEFRNVSRRRRSISCSNKPPTITFGKNAADDNVDDVNKDSSDEKIDKIVNIDPKFFSNESKVHKENKKCVPNISRKKTLDVIEISHNDLVRFQKYVDEKSKVQDEKNSSDELIDINVVKQAKVNVRKSFEEEIKRRRSSMQVSDVMQIVNIQKQTENRKKSTSDKIHSSHHSPSIADVSLDDNLEGSAPKLVYGLPTVLFFIVVLVFIITNGGREGMMTGLLYTYVESFLHWQPFNGTILVTTYHLIRVIVHCVFIYLANKISPFILTLFNCSVLLVGGLLMLGTSKSSEPVFTYISVILTGIATSNIQPTTITLVQKSIQVTGKIMGVLFAALAAGQIIFSPVLGIFLEKRGAVAFPAMIFLTSVLSSLLFTPWYFLAKYVKRFYEKRRSQKFDAKEWYLNYKRKLEKANLNERTPLRKN
ncbi:hypothetical protein HELRODRAFT_190294 [Helobdella robusta]|uniref:Major facilitator superfamily (MFS) profile domain-containing protein n=1 Tax=Helobdella robusta TaxID=6412 RepID=T1FRV5_HELRO|nr:hypothetical protein HELRODRAFT_190294 [Helobdella robusta]ESO11092.1 hypothetical protein HELRODRAFT_190294 [Helobdella robusta]